MTLVELFRLLRRQALFHPVEKYVHLISLGRRSSWGSSRLVLRRNCRAHNSTRQDVNWYRRIAGQAFPRIDMFIYCCVVLSFVDTPLLFPTLFFFMG